MSVQAESAADTVTYGDSIVDVLDRLRGIQHNGEDQPAEIIMHAYELCMKIEAGLPEVTPMMDEWIAEAGDGTYIATLITAADEAMAARRNSLADTQEPGAAR